MQSGDPVPRYVFHCHAAASRWRCSSAGPSNIGKTPLAVDLEERNIPLMQTDRLLGNDPETTNATTGRRWPRSSSLTRRRRTNFGAIGRAVAAECPKEFVDLILLEAPTRGRPVLHRGRNPAPRRDHATSSPAPARAEHQALAGVADPLSRRKPVAPRCKERRMAPTAPKPRSAPSVARRPSTAALDRARRGDPRAIGAPGELPKWPSADGSRRSTPACIGLASMRAALRFVETLERADGARRRLAGAGSTTAAVGARIASALLTRGGPAQLDLCDAWPADNRHPAATAGFPNRVFAVSEALEDRRDRRRLPTTSPTRSRCSPTCAATCFERQPRGRCSPALKPGGPALRHRPPCRLPAAPRRPSRTTSRRWRATGSGTVRPATASTSASPSTERACLERLPVTGRARLPRRGRSLPAPLRATGSHGPRAALTGAIG